MYTFYANASVVYDDLQAKQVYIIMTNQMMEEKDCIMKDTVTEKKVSSFWAMNQHSWTLWCYSPHNNSTDITLSHKLFQCDKVIIDKNEGNHVSKFQLTEEDLFLETANFEFADIDSYMLDFMRCIVAFVISKWWQMVIKSVLL